MSVALNDANSKDVRQFLGPMKPNFPILKPDSDPGDAFALGPIPCNIVIGPDGMILERMEGAFHQEEWNERVIPHIEKQA